MVRSDSCPPPKFCAIPKISMKGDSMAMLPLILPKVIMIHNVWCFYVYKIGEVDDYKMHATYEKLWNEGILKNEFKNFEKKGLTHVLEFPRNFKIEWIKVILRRIHDMKFWL